MARAPRLEDLPPHLRAAVEASARERGIDIRGSDSAIGAVLDVEGDSRARRLDPRKGVGQRPTVHSIARERAGGVAQVRRAGTPNRTEGRFRDEILEPMRLAGELTRYEFEPLTFKLADGVRYTPDWIARRRSGDVVAYEVKAHALAGRTSTGRVKLATAADRFDWLVAEFYRVTRAKGSWTFERIYPLSRSLPPSPKG